MKLKLNNADNYEPLYVNLSPDKTPIAYAAKVRSLMKTGMNQEVAERMALEPIPLELYCDEDTGLFAVETDAVDSGTIYNPYNGELLDESNAFDVEFNEDEEG